MLRLCGAKARTNKYQPCKQPAMANGRCRLHGGLTPKRNSGPKTEEGKLRQKMSNWKHGFRSREFREENRLLREMINQYKDNLKNI